MTTDLFESEDVEAALCLPADFPYDDLHAIAGELERAQIFVPGYVPPPVGLYHPDGFLYEEHCLRVKTVLLPDRNIVSRMAQVAQGLDIDGPRRTAAAVLAFAQCLDIEIEPSIAFHELAPQHGNKRALEELAWFRAADNGHVHDWIAAALGRVERLPIASAPPINQQLDLAKPLRRWRRNYIATMKICALELSAAPPLDRLFRLFEWMHRDFIIAGPAAMFACLYFAPNSPPRRGLLKSLRSSDRNRALAGARNAAWDLTHLSDFVERVSKAKNGRTRYVFASLDESLRHIARLVFGTEQNTTEQNDLAGALARWWPEPNAVAIADALQSLFSRINEPNRQIHRQQTLGFINEMIVKGEAELLTWQPT
ncbi:hypothetical protein [Pseudomonas aeruginosa]|uniref:hypothetical protein n=1 Tax=Pseudomonas aeruginosa TaxID=287 RepID=UPI002E212090|nr:hypothetical protein [Pseudomonas aeruginosa]